LQINNAVVAVSQKLRDMENKIIGKTLSKTEAAEMALNADFLKVAKEEYIQDITQHVSLKNVAHEGCILWLKAGASRQLKPEPIYLNETLTYFSEHNTYDSTNYEFFDICGLNTDQQFKVITDRMLMTAAPPVVFKDKVCFDMARIERLRGFVVDSQPSPKKMNKVVTALREIVAVAKHVYEDILAKKLCVVDTDGTSSCCTYCANFS
jgi:hypothetical protein